MVTSFESARDLILQNVSTLGSETVQLLEALGRNVAEDIIAPTDMPRWDNSAMDGYAVRADDCREATALSLIDYLPAGVSSEGVVVRPGTAVKIMTGAPVPVGCTAIVPVEETTEGDYVVHINGRVKVNDHIRFQGEDVRTGDTVVPAGTVLRPAEINLLASLGKVFITVYRQPKVAILSTGDELVEPGEMVGAGQVVNSNAFSLAAAVKELGGKPVLLGIAKDNRDSLLERLKEGMNADVLITSAGVSAGERDLVRDILEELGVEQKFWRVNIKPGRPTAFGLRQAKPVFSLPGNPVSTMVTFEEFVRPALLKMMGHKQVIKPTVKAKLMETTKKQAGRAQFLRVRVSKNCSGLVAASSGDQNTGIVRTMLGANGIAFLPEDRDTIESGEFVDVHLIDAFGSHNFY